MITFFNRSACSAAALLAALSVIVFCCFSGCDGSVPSSTATSSQSSATEGKAVSPSEAEAIFRNASTSEEKSESTPEAK